MPGAYLNNAATTWPKPPRVAEAMSEFLTRGGANLARGAASARDIGAMNLVMDCRVKIAELFGGYGRDPRYVTFCANVTEALNVVLKGFVRNSPNARILLSPLQHNSVTRGLAPGPVMGLVEAREGALPLVGVGAIKGFFSDDVKASSLRPTGGTANSPPSDPITGPGPTALVVNGGSNVCGTIQPLREIADFCRERGIFLVVDGAQTAGVVPVNVEELGIAAFCFTGHKGLMGPQGIGGIVWNPEFAERVAPLIEGGTGSYSHLETQPSDMPDKFEAGTPNLPGIAGLSAALDWIAETGIENIAARERALGEYFLQGLENFRRSLAPRGLGVLSYGNKTAEGRDTMEGRLPVFSVNIINMNEKAESGKGRLLDNGILAGALAERGFETRPGLHCAPRAHRELGTFPEGSLRVSLGYFNTTDELDAFWEALREVLEECTGTI
ncbi:MAG: aminotransferase class V-fold PLP-dependent enzyme [Synergistaceae bacterium]|jgi:selenocysteine lyase/cysteine desulfurase|nr:aminotransferase class V-fold PLP-dependent enzyme [Synergistaceae bacterium]